MQFVHEATDWVRALFDRWHDQLRAKMLAWFGGVPFEDYERIETWLRTAQADLGYVTSVYNNTRAALTVLERTVGTEIGKRMLEEIGYELAKPLRRAVSEAVREACIANGVTRPDSVTIEVGYQELMWADPTSIERLVIERWQEEIAPNLSARAFLDGEVPVDDVCKFVRLDIRVPELGYCHTIWDR